MKQFLFKVMILSCFVFNAQEIAANEIKQVDVLSITAFENQFICSGASNIFNHSANKETCQQTIQRLFPTFHKSMFFGLLNEKERLFRKNEISTYVCYAECHITRFKGVDIIHPFNYFW